MKWNQLSFCPECKNENSEYCEECVKTPLVDCGIDLLPLHYKMDWKKLSKKKWHSPRKYTEEEVREIALKFFYWWWNKQGDNTEQGWEKFWEKFGENYVKCSK